MATDLTDFGNWLAVPSVVCLWAAVLLRAPGALRSPQQRGLWLAVATAAAAMTLNLPDVVSYAMSRGPGYAHTIGLVRNLIGVLSAGAVLYFVAATTRGRKLQLTACVATVAWLTTLVALDVAAPGHGTHTMPPVGDPVPSLAYWLVLISAHVVANIVCVGLCSRYSRRTESRGLAAGLRLFGLGTALAGLFWLAYLLKALFGSTWAMPALPLLMNLHGLLRAAAILVPTLFTLRRTWADTATTWRLWPLWRDLVEAVPHVALNKPRAWRVMELLLPPVPRNLLVYRKVIETRDAILILGEYVAPGALEQARGQVTGTGVPEQRATAAALARVLKEARQAKLDGVPGQPGEAAALELPAAIHTSQEGGDLADEARFLVDVAQAYAAPTTTRK
ncbi:MULTISPECIES: MAB_1171c family putative transporter [unclassified Streptomyces]|uniref:MAB_1171c family putative transporter n=1 Tax=unclassified Streptomyces TaxID=2593676 RepID=UPI00068EFFDC|nr:MULTISPECIES: MAB_1171c family putative transporter [unclassified Streptomyces]